MNINRCKVSVSDVHGEDPVFECQANDDWSNCEYCRKRELSCMYYREGGYCKSGEARVDTASTYIVILKRWLSKNDKGNDL